MDDSKKVKTQIRVRRHRAISNNLSNQNKIIQSKMANGLSASDDSDSDDEEYVISGQKQLQIWAIKNNITQNALCELLKILISFGLNWLPSDARTLLKTPKKVQIVDLANGKVWYSGLENNFREIFSKLSENMQLILNFNVDGLPLYNSSKDEFWPILGNFHSKNSLN